MHPAVLIRIAKMTVLFPGVKVFLCTTATDIRRGFDGLSGVTQSLLQKDPMSGQLSVFRNRNGET